MTQKDKELLLKDLCARLSYGVKFILSGAIIYTMKGVDLIVTDEGDWEYAVAAKGIEPIEIEYVKPYLRPMSSITEEEKEEASEAIEIELKALQGPGGFTVENAASYAFMIDFYNKHHLDYRGLIEKGLALEAPEGMYEVQD